MIVALRATGPSPDSGDRGGIILRSEDSGPGDDGVCACFDRQPGGFKISQVYDMSSLVACLCSARAEEHAIAT